MKRPPFPTKETPTRVLQVVGRMERGGVESWLLNVMRTIDRSRFQVDFLLHSPQPGAYDNELRALGARLFVCPHFRNPARYAAEVLSVLREHGPYDVVHSHVHHFSGIPISVAALAGVPIRVAHSHNDLHAVEEEAGAVRRLYLGAMRGLIRRFATDGLAASVPAAVSLFGSDWERDDRWQTLHCGIDLSPYRTDRTRADVRAEFGLGNETRLIVHVGSFTEQKNHRLIIEVAEEMLARDKDVYFLLIGDGPLRPAIESQVAALTDPSHVILAGGRDDVHRLLLASDAFLFPSLFEGLGLALVEAQAAGLPCVISAEVPPEADVVPELIQRLDLNAPIENWTAAIDQALAMEHPVGTVDRIAETPFSIDYSLDRLCDVYKQSLESSG